MTRADIIRTISVGFLGLILAACNPIAVVQETQPQITQNITASEEASATQVASTASENTPTPENTPTATKTATPEATASVFCL